MIDIEEVIKQLATSQPSMAALLLAMLVADLVLLVLSVQQMASVNDAGDRQILGAFMTGWQYGVCQNDLIQLLSPFLFDFVVAHYEEEIGQLGCPWRERNSIWRCVIICLQIIVTLWMFIILMTKQQAKFWYLLCWTHWLGFVFLFVFFILDTEGLYRGYDTCDNNFDVTGYGPVVLALLGAEFTTTLPPYFYGPYRPNWQYQQYDDTTVISWNLAIADQCYMTPFIYTLGMEILVIGIEYAVFTIGRMYDIDDEPPKRRRDEVEDIEDDEIEAKIVKKKKRLPLPFLRKKKQNKVGEDGELDLAPTHRTRKMGKESLAEADGNRPENQSAYDLPRVSLSRLGSLDEPYYDPQGTEPAHWRERKPTYDDF